MPFIIWDERFSLGVKQFDGDHQVLVELLNRAYDDFYDGASNENVHGILEEMVAYANYHFAAEEQWMQKLSYPKLNEHRSEHERFLKKVFEMLGAYPHNNKLLMETMTFLNSWLINHILKSDAEYGRYNAAILNNSMLDEVHSV
jgi:hemerythrin